MFAVYIIDIIVLKYWSKRSRSKDVSHMTWGAPERYSQHDMTLCHEMADVT